MGKILRDLRNKLKPRGELQKRGGEDDNTEHHIYFVIKKIK